MSKKVTRTLYINGKKTMQLTQPDGEGSPLERMENLAAKLQLEHHAQCRPDVGNDGTNSLGIGKILVLKALQLKQKFLYALLKKLLLSHKPAMQHHIVCLCVERDMDTSTQTPRHSA